MPALGLPYVLPFWMPGPPAVAPAQQSGINPVTSALASSISLLRQRLLVQTGTALPNVQLLLQVFANQCDALETAFQQLFFYRQLANSYGQLLDDIGVLVGLPRNGLDDTTYRLYLKAQIRADSSAGTTEDLNAIFELIVPVGVAFDLEWQFQAAFVIYLTDPGGILTQAELNAFEAFMHNARAAGVDGIMEFPPPGIPDDELFSFMTSTDMFDINGSGPTGGIEGMDQGYFRGAVN